MSAQTEMQKDIREVKNDIKELIRITAGYKTEIVIHRGLILIQMTAICGLVWRILIG